MLADDTITRSGRRQARAAASERMTKTNQRLEAYYEKLRDRPPRRTLLAALDDSACHPLTRSSSTRLRDGRDVIGCAAAGRWWPSTPSRGAAHCSTAPAPGATSRRSCAAGGVPLPIGVSLVNSSFACRFAKPEAFRAV